MLPLAFIAVSCGKHNPKVDNNPDTSEVDDDKSSKPEEIEKKDDGETGGGITVSPYNPDREYNGEIIH